MRSRTTLATLTFFLALACATASGHAGEGPANFGVVEKGRIYRGAQPDRDDLEWLKEQGVRTILKLNESHLREERAAAEKLGLRLVHIPLRGEAVGTAEECKAVENAYAALIDPANGPIYVHCTHGRDRTGFLIGLFRERQQKWKWADVSRELALYGHGAKYRLALPNISGSLRMGVAQCR